MLGGGSSVDRSVGIWFSYEGCELLFGGYFVEKMFEEMVCIGGYVVGRVRCFFDWELDVGEGMDDVCVVGRGYWWNILICYDSWLDKNLVRF